MAYSLNSGEPVAEGLKRIGTEELESAARGLRAPKDQPEEAVHEARKSVKKVRALIRLVQGKLGDNAAELNVRLRDAGRKLSPLRDAAAMLEVMETLEEKLGARVAAATLARIRKGLRAGLPAAGLQKTMRSAATVLAQVGRAVPSWPLEGDCAEALEQGLRRSYRAGRRAFAAARKRRRDEDFHEWRKRAKDHWYHLRLLNGAPEGKLVQREVEFKELSELLGDSQNLVVLRQMILADPAGFGTGPALDGFLERLSEIQEELRTAALEAGEWLYAEKPRKLARAVQRWWNQERAAQTARV